MNATFAEVHSWKELDNMMGSIYTHCNLTWFVRVPAAAWKFELDNMISGIFAEPENLRVIIE